MSAISATAKAFCNTFFPTWSLLSSAIYFILYSYCIYLFFKIIVSLCVTPFRTLKMKLINYNVATIYSDNSKPLLIAMFTKNLSGLHNESILNPNKFSGDSTTLKSIGLISNNDKKTGGLKVKNKQVCTVELDPGEVPSLYKEEQEQLQKEYSGEQGLTIPSEDSFEILIQKSSKSEENYRSFHERLAFWRRKEKEEIIYRRKLK